MRIANPSVKETNVEIRLSRPYGNDPDEGTFVSLELEDRNTSLTIGSIRLDAESLTDLMTNRGAKGTGKFYAHALDCVGKKRIAQSITMNFAEGEDASEVFATKVNEIESEYEGWRCNDRTFNSKHYDHTKRQYPMTLIKWVTPEELQQIKDLKQDVE